MLRPISAAFLITFAGLAAIPSTSLAQPAANAPNSEVISGTSIPLSRLTLYRSGVGSFQRNGIINNNAKVQLRFNTDTINDILKSMVILDKSGGTIEGASYGSKDPLERRLASFAINVADNPKFSELVSRLRGSEATLVTTDGSVTGVILSVENRTETRLDQGKNTSVNIPFANIITSGGIRSVNLDSIRSFTLSDQALQAELNKALAALAEYRAERTKTVEIGFRGEGARDIVISYVHELPVWKASYRLVLPDEKPNANDKVSAPQIQGWAIVENTTDEDWQNIKLSLVSGRPVSFKMDLYEPLYVARPTVPVPTVPGVAPRIYDLGKGISPSEQANRDPGRAAPGSPAPARSAGTEGRKRMEAGLELQYDKAGAPPASISADDMTGYAAQAQAQAVETGEVFQYELVSPVTIQRQRSSMLPIITSSIDGRRLSIFNRADGSEHPMRGVELTNSTAAQLLPGPVAVFDTGIYAGDAQIGHVSPGDKRLLAYAVDLDVASQVKEDNNQSLRKVRIVSGLLEHTYTYRRSIEYSFSNKDSKRGRTVLIEHPKDGFADLIEPKKPSEETNNLFRFELPLDAGKAGSLKVVQETVQYSTLELLGFDIGMLTRYSTEGKVSKAVLDAYRDASRRNQLVIDAQRKLNELEKEKAGISEDQNRVRQNLTSIDKTSDLYRRYMTKLNDQETRLETLNQELAAARASHESLRNDLNNFIANLNVE